MLIELVCFETEAGKSFIIRENSAGKWRARVESKKRPSWPGKPRSVKRLIKGDQSAINKLLGEGASGVLTFLACGPESIDPVDRGRFSASSLFSWSESSSTLLAFLLLLALFSEER